jgi:hypothetical protein
MTKHPTPPVPQIPEAAIADVAAAISAAFRTTPISPADWTAEARAAISAYRRHLTAEQDAENTRLRAENEQLRRDTNLGWEARHAAEDDLNQVIEALGLDPESVQLEDVVERAEKLVARDAAWKAYAADLAQLVTSIGFDAWRGVDKGHDVLDDIYQATVVPPLPAVLADPAPSAPEEQQP